MKKITGFGRRGGFGLKPAQCAAILCSATVAGCSADVARFDSSSFNFNDPPEQTASVERPVEPVRGGSDYASPVAHSTPRGPYGVGAASDSSVDMAALPEPTPAPAGPAAAFGGQRPAAQAPSYQPYRPATAVAAAAPAAKGQLIEIQQGDTLYGLSKRHQVSINELMQVNELKSPNLRLGQKLYLPAGRTAGAAPSRPLEAAAPAAAALSQPTAEQLAKYNGSYTVKPGDSLYAIARANRVNFAELQQVNGITDPRKVRPGTVLKVPASAVVASTEPMAPASIAPAATPAVAPAASPAMTPTAAPATQPTILNKPAAGTAPAKTEVAAIAPKAAAAPAADVATGKLRWPATGKIIAGFGGRADGTHNDGINVSVPLGTDVHAAESGVVAYSGNELKGYGNLVLIRHDNGWVTAYAHNDELLVKHGDKIARGQVIAKAGKTGSVDQPQVHFELRQGSKPVDPTPYLERL